MAEVFGVVAGAVNIAATFSTVIEVFDYIQLGSRFGRDYQTSQLKLTLLRLRLSRWGEAVDVYNDPQLGNPSATKAEIQAAKDTLLQILALFEDSSRISRKFATRDGADPPPGTAGEPDLAAALTAENKMRALARRRQKGTSFARLTRWAVQHSTALRTLIDDISVLVNDLEVLFPAPQSHVEALASEEVAQVQSSEAEVRALAIASEQLDAVMHKAASTAAERFGGHRFRDVEISDVAAVQNGDAYYAGFDPGAGKEMPRGALHSFEGVRIKGNGRTKVLNGDRFGGADPFG